jgi:hypothetical protein
MERFSQFCKGILFLSIAGCLIFLTFAANQTLNNIEADVLRTTEFSRNEISQLREDTFEFLETTSTRLDRRVASIETKTFTRIDSIESNTFASLERMESNINRITDETILLSQDYRKVANTVDRLEPFLNCEENDFCWQNLATDSMISFRNVSIDANKTFLLVNENVPRLTEDFTRISNSLSLGVPKIVENSGEITKNINALTKPRWYDRLIGWGVNSSLIWFNINRSLIK